MLQTLAIEGEKCGTRVNWIAPKAATAMTGGVLPEAALARLDPEFVSPGAIRLVGEDAPDGTLLCAGAGHFAPANITSTKNAYIGSGDEAAGRMCES